VLAAVLAVLLAIVLLTRSSAPARLSLGAVRQDTQLDPLPVTLTNEPLVLLGYVNEYRTSPGWITSSNDRIYAGVADRTWSAPYEITSYKHEVNIFAGAGVGVQYTYTLGGRYPIGATILYADTVRVFASAGYKW
jgi:hypothetical protein